MPLQLFINFFGSILFLATFSLTSKISRFFTLFNKIFQFSSNTFRIILRIGDSCYLTFKISQLIIICFNLLFSKLDLLLQSLYLYIELLELECFFLVLLTFSYELIKHVFKIAFPTSYLLYHFCLFLFKTLNFTIKHISKIFKGCLLISCIFAGILFTFYNL